MGNPIEDLTERVSELETELAAHKALLVGVVAAGGNKTEEIVLHIREQVQAQSPKACDYIDAILNSIERQGRNRH